MRSSLVTLHLIVATAFILFYIMPASAKFVCLPCNSQEECDRDPPEYCYWGEVRDACNRRMCAKGPGERCGGALNVLGQCGEGLMCKSDEICHGCSILTMKCYND